MGKRQHQKDKMYLTYTEWSTLYGGKRPGHTSKEEANFKRLPFDHCCLSLQPFEIPYCDIDGNIFDLQALIPYLKKFKSNPVSGKPLDFKSLIQLNINRNAEDEFECPVLFKPFTNSSHIAAIATTGNVFLMEAIEQLNIKNKNWKDLISDQPFERKDVIVLQDPNNLSKFNISSFHHIKNNMRVETEEEIADKSDPQARLKSINPETKYTLNELNRDYKTPTIQINKPESSDKADKFNAAHYSTGAVAASFTSTAMVPKLIHEAAIIHEDEIRYERVKKKVTAYTTEEKEILKQLIIKYPVIEEKKTDATSIKRKTEAWNSVMNEFNVHSGNTKRTVLQLKRCWDKIKRSRKVQLAEERRHQMGTGGGPATPEKKSQIDVAVPHLTYDISHTLDSDGPHLPIKKNVPSTSSLVEVVEMATTEENILLKGEDNIDLAALSEDSISSADIKNRYYSITPKRRKIETRETATNSILSVSLKNAEAEKIQSEQLHAIRMQIAMEDLEAAKLKRRAAELKVQIAEVELTRIKLKEEKST